MRINAGKFRNHNIDMCNLETTRETSDKVRQAMFNLIGQFFDGEVVLDLFTGSGALGFEAISRGCKKAYLNDLNNKALDVVKKNASKLKLTDEVSISNLDYRDFLNTTKEKFDLIFLDPPYNMTKIDDILSLIKKNDCLNKKGLIIFEMEKNTNPKSSYYEILKERSYGIKKVVIYKMVN